MQTTDIISQVDDQGYCVFDLSQTAKECLENTDLSSLDDGFHINNSAHCELISKVREISEIIEAVKFTTSKNKIEWNTINVTRVVKQKSSEKYRTHFDSHLYTLVVPLRTSNLDEQFKGQLYLAPNLRKQPKFDLLNVFQKIMAFRWKGEGGFNKLKNLDKIRVFDLQVGQAILFNGSRCLHGNLANDSDATRITLITHMADPFPNGIGELVRRFRKATGLRK